MAGLGKGEGTVGYSPFSRKVLPLPIKNLEPYRVADHATEAGEEILAVDGAGAGLGVVLHGEDGLLVGKTTPKCRRSGLRVTTTSETLSISTQKPWFWEEISTCPVEVFNRVVTAVVAEFQLAGRAAQSVAEKLMAEADARHGIAFDELLDGHDFVGEGRRVAGAVGQEHGLSAAGLDLFGGEGRRNDQYVEALFGQKAQGCSTDAEVIGDEARASPGQLPRSRRR